ncbi:hypothetical protein ACVINY_004736 [Sinorhizobium meliloti]
MGDTLKVCFLEAVLREEIYARRYAEIETIADLRLVDLREGHAIRMGVPTDVAKSSRQSLGRAWSLAFHEHRSVPDGIIYPSRLNGHTNLAIFDRAISKLSAVRRAINWSTGPCHHHQRSSCEPRRHHLDQGHETQTGRTCQRWTSRCRAHEAANSALAA